MKVNFSFQNEEYIADLLQPIDVSIPMHSGGPRAWYVQPMRIAPVIMPYVVGSVKLGGAVNFRDVWFNPHGHGTHTESVGHITKEEMSVNGLNLLPSVAQLITVTPEERGTDRVITHAQLQAAGISVGVEALVVRSLPNNDDKRSRNYSGTNFPYFEAAGLAWLAQQGIRHLLTDLPSVDREEDGGALAGHRAFWYVDGRMRGEATITEMIYAPNDVVDGLYLLQLQTAPFENDASPSRPLLYAMIKHKK